MRQYQNVKRPALHITYFSVRIPVFWVRKIQACAGPYDRITFKTAHSRLTELISPCVTGSIQQTKSNSNYYRCAHHHNKSDLGWKVFGRVGSLKRLWSDNVGNAK